MCPINIVAHQILDFLSRDHFVMGPLQRKDSIINIIILTQIVKVFCFFVFSPSSTASFPPFPLRFGHVLLGGSGGNWKRDLMTVKLMLSL